MYDRDPSIKPVLQGQCVWPVTPNQAMVEGDAMLFTPYDDPFRRPETGFLGLPRVEYQPIRIDGIITPAFCDWHFHYVQHRVAGHGKPLLPWLREDAWPEEARFADQAFADVAAQGFAKKQLAAGTVAGACWCSPHPASVRAAKNAGVRFSLIGPAVMTAGEPPNLVRPLAEYLRELKDLQIEFEEALAVSPRFALSCNADDLKELARFAYDYTLWTQTHLAENPDEVAAVAKHFKNAKSYTDVYDQAGLLTPRTLLAHCVHLSEFDWRTIKQRGSIVVHCPTSNEALKSGRMPLEKVRALDIPWVLGSDIGAGPDLCMLDVIEAAMRVHDWEAPVTAVEAFFRATVSLETLETYASRKSRITRVFGTGRAGFVEFKRPRGIDKSERDPEKILLALIAQYDGHAKNSIAAVYDAECNLLYENR